MRRLLLFTGTYRDMRVTCTSLGVSCREDSVNKHKSANDLSTQSCACAVPVSHCVSTTSKRVVVWLHEGLDQANTTDCAQALSHHVAHGPD